MTITLRLLSILAVVSLTLAACTEYADTEEFADETPTTEVRLPDDVAANAWEVSPLLPGMTSPALELTAADGSTWTHDPTAMEHPLILTFYRGGWCPYCNRHLSALRKADADLKEMGFDMVFASADRPEILEPSADDPTFGYTVVSDQDLAASRAFGIAYQVDEATVNRYEGTRMDLDENSGRDHHWLPAPATFVISSDGTIQFAYVNPNYRVRVSPEVVLAAARSTVEVEEKLRAG